MCRSLKSVLHMGKDTQNVYFNAIMASPLQNHSWFGDCCMDTHLATHLLNAM